MIDIVTLVPCSDADRAAHDSPIGSASAFSRYLLIDYRAPWGRQAADDAVRDRVDPEIDIAGMTGLRAFAIRPVAQRRSAPLRPLIFGEIGSGDADSLFVGVCTNARRDRCCAVRGRPVALALHEEFGDCISEISHLGGHRFAATMLVLPFGYYYGQLDPVSAREVVTAAQRGLVHPENLRGRADLSPAAQAADAMWRRDIGPAPIDAVTILGERQVDGDVEVDALVQGAHQIRRVRRIPGPVITETACGGKPIRTGEWASV